MYLLLPTEKSIDESSNFANLETKNIDLFANNEENNPIIEKFNEINKSAPDQINPDYVTAENTIKDEVPEIITAEAEPVVSPAEKNAENSSDVLYAPDDDDFDITEKEPQTIALKKDIIPESAEKTENESIISDKNIETANAENEEVLEIADAAEAKVFSIPLIHNFETPKQNVKISNEADDSQVALASNNVRMQNLGTQNKMATASLDNFSAKEKSAQPDYTDPWVVATAGNEHIQKNKLDAVTNSPEVQKADAGLKAPEAVNSDNEKKVAYKMMKNILIPIPEDIANDENLTPQLSYSEENKKLSKKLLQNGELSADTSAHDDEPEKTINQTTIKDAGITPMPPKAEKPAQTENTSSTTSLTDSIAAWFSSSAKNKSSDSGKGEQNNSASGNSAFSKLLGLGKKDNSCIAPSELKLAFQPNRAEISGQTLEWLRAFSDNAVKNDDVFIEIRIDGSGSYELQQKRLNLLYSILINNGVDYNKINIIFTDREPNSFIIRNVRYASEEDANKARKKAYNPWY